MKLIIKHNFISLLGLILWVFVIKRKFCKAVKFPLLYQLIYFRLHNLTQLHLSITHNWYVIYQNKSIQKQKNLHSFVPLLRVHCQLFEHTAYQRGWMKELPGLDCCVGWASVQVSLLLFFFGLQSEIKHCLHFHLRKTNQKKTTTHRVKETINFRSLLIINLPLFTIHPHFRTDCISKREL